MSFDKKLKRKLEIWSDAGLITREQIQKILAYEEYHVGAPAFLFMVAWLAAACIVLGIIALIASNWESIPDIIKLSAYFLGFAALGGTLLFKKNLAPLAQEIMRLALMGYCLAGIGLVAQIYHLHSEPWRGIAFCCLITFGLALGSTGPWGALLWLPAALYSWFSFLNSMQVPHTWISVIGICSTGLLGIFGTLPNKKSSNLIHFRHISFAFAVGACLVFTIAAPYALHDSFRSHIFFPFLAMGIAWAATLWFLPTHYNRSTRLAMVTFIAVTFVHLPFQALTHALGVHELAFRLLTFLLFVIGTLSLAIAAFAHGYKKIFEALCIFIFLRLLALYVESLMSLQAKGFGLILLGAAILAGILAWKKYKPRIYAKLEGELHADD